MKPARFTKAIALSFALGAVLSVGTDRNITHQVQAISLAKAQAVGAGVMKAVSGKVGEWLEQGLEVVLKGLADRLAQSE